MLNEIPDKEQIFIKSWGKVRSKGRLRNAIILGLLCSLSASIAVSLLDILVYKVDPMPASIGGFIGGFVGGVIGSFNIWKKNEKRYSELISKLPK